MSKYEQTSSKHCELEMIENNLIINSTCIISIIASSTYIINNGYTTLKQV